MKDAQISQRDLGVATGISKTTINKYAQNKVQQYDAEVVSKLCDFFGIDVRDFFYSDR